MRILTVRQPWAWAIIHGGKDVENRVRNIAGDYRGAIAIHAAKVDDPEAWRRLVKTNLAAWGRAMESPRSLVGGAILGVVNLTAVHECRPSQTRSFSGLPVCFDSETPIGEVCSTWAEVGTYHLELENPRPLSEPIPYKGALGLRRLDDDTSARILAQIGAPDGAV